jgi:cytochrome c oxidase subunit 2
MNGLHDVLLSGGVQADRVIDLWRLLLWVCSGVFGLVLVGLAWALWRAPSVRNGSRPLHPDGPARARLLHWRIALATLVSTLLLVGLTAASIATGRALAGLSLDGALHVEVTAHQWWWELRYEDDPPGALFSTANELHVPVGRPVLLRLRSDDVIHSLWVPSLGGKRDLVPGHEVTFTFRADRPGVYLGRCAEFCGLQHAAMSLQVVAHAPAEFDAWIARQREPARAPTTAQRERGRTVFSGASCAMCHSITGTDAGGRRAPDLTHVASRRTIAAGALPMGEESLAHWITDPQSVKPGTNMPPTVLTAEDLQALVAYLGSLQ